MKIVYCMMLVLGITGITCAQEKRISANDIFSVSPDYFRVKYEIILGKGNILRLELRDLKDLSHVANPDSLLRILLTDIMPLRDSMTDELTSKRIDYVTDSAGRKKIRLGQTRPKSSTFLIDHGDLSALKLEQDTVVFILSFSDGPNYKKKGTQNIKHYRMSFFVNQLDDLNNYHDGRLNEKLMALRENVTGWWVGGMLKNWAYLHKDSSITAEHSKGYLSEPGLLINLGPTLNFQNYKNYFAPSFSLGALFTISSSYFKHEVGLYWEPTFLFSKDAQGKLQTFRNDFLTLALGHGFIKDHNPQKKSDLLAVFSYSYLIRRSGDIVAKNTSRFSVGQFNALDGHLKLEPSIYFNNFFKEVTPAVRMSLEF